MKRFLGHLVLMGAFFFGLSAAQAADVFVVQATPGTGTSCASGAPIGSVNWTPANTYHLCGPFTSPIVPTASGTSNQVLNILGEPGSRISMPAIPNSGGISLHGKQWINLDGQHNLVIESTNNGTNSGKVNSVGVEVTGSNLQVHGLIIQNLYKYTCCNNDQGGLGIFGIGDNIKNIHIFDNSCSAMFACVETQLGANTGNIEVDHIRLPNPDVAWGIVVVQGFSNSSTNGVLIHDNDLQAGSGVTPGSGNSWCTGKTDFNHLDPIHTWSQGNGGGILNTLMYRNHIHGSFCVVGGTANSTAAMFWEAHVDGGSAPNRPKVFNNLIEIQGGHPGDGGIYKQTGTDGDIWYNTVDGKGGDSGTICMEMGGGGSATLIGNILQNCPNNGTLLDGGTVTGSGNVYFNDGGQTNTVGVASTSNPNLDATHAPTAATPVIGTNLTSQGIAELNVGRPVTGNWTPGAFTGPAGPPPPPPPPPASGSLASPVVTGLSVKLTWAASVTPNVSGYNVLRSTVSGGPYAQVGSVAGNVLTFTDNTVLSNTTYFYVVRAQISGVESANSNQVTAAIPVVVTPPPPPPPPPPVTSFTGNVNGNLTPAPLVFSATQGSTAAQSKTVIFDDISPNAQPFTVTCSQPWCKVTADKLTTKATLTITINPTGLTTSTSAAVSIVAPALANATAANPLKVTVNLTLAGTPPPPQPPPVVPAVQLSCVASVTQVTCTSTVSNYISLSFVYNGNATSFTGLKSPLPSQFILTWARGTLPAGANTFSVTVSDGTQTATAAANLSL